MKKSLLIIIIFIAPLWVSGQVSEYQKKITFYKEPSETTKACDNCRLIVTQKHIYITTDTTTTHKIQGSMRTGWKTFYKLEGGAFLVLMVDDAIMERGGQSTKYTFKPKKRKKEGVMYTYKNIKNH